MSAPRPHRPEEDNVDSWLMSYADMITLLLAFFVIFVSTSEPKQDRLAAATRGMQERFGVVSLESPYDGAYKNIVGIVSGNNADSHVAVEKTKRGLQIELSSQNFFTPGRAEIPPEQLPMLKDMARSLANGKLVSYAVEIQGHTSDVPLAEGSPFASNWELAAARATRVVRLLIEEGIAPARLHAASYADTQPALPNRDEQGNAIDTNRAKNERIVITVEKTR